MYPTRWADLPPELLHEVSGHLHDSTDFVRFHAVCKPWRGSYGPASARKTTTDQFLPWLLAPNEEEDDSLRFRCVFSKSTYLAPPPPTSGTGRNWVASADGTSLCYFTSNPLQGPTLHDPLTGAALTHLPRFFDGQWEEENPMGTIYDDGTVLLYSKYDDDGGGGDDDDDDDMAEVSAALLRPGDDEWTVIHRILQFGANYYGEFCVAYHNGRILVTVQRNVWLAVPLAMTPTTATIDDVLVPRPPSMPLDYDGYVYEYSYVIESRGELLWAAVHVSVDYPGNYTRGVHGLVRALMVSVHALEDAPALRWVRKKGTSLSDRVLFLGWPNSFAVDASRLGVTGGGFVYFIYDDDKGGCPPDEQRGVFRYNLIDNTTEFVEWLPDGWDDEMCAWLIPQPIIAPMHQGPASTLQRSDNFEAPC